jgi:hypothetical protein
MENKEINVKIKINTENNTAEITILTPNKQEVKFTEKVKFKKEMPSKKEIEKLLYKLQDNGLLEEIYKHYGNEQTFKLSNGLTVENKALNVKIELIMEVRKEYKTVLTTFPSLV